MDTQTPTYALILAGGKGSRMKTKIPKPCLCVGGKSMLQHVIDAVKEANISHIVIVYCPLALENLKECVDCPEDYVWTRQMPLLGTGHAVECAFYQDRKYFLNKKGNLVVLNADAPFISSLSIQNMLSVINQGINKIKAAVLCCELENPFGYGRILLTEDSVLLRIVEEMDASEEEKRIQKVNGGVYVFDIETLQTYIEFLDEENAKEEYYLTDIFEILRENGHRSVAVFASCSREIANINTPEDLKRARCMV